MKTKIKNLLLNNKYLLLTFGIATFLFLLIFSFKSIIPIGNNTLLTVDFYHQYGPLLSELYDKIKSGVSLNYSFATGLGLPFFRNFYNYLSSPFNIIILLFSRDNIVTAFSIIIALKIIIASTVMTYFLKKFFNKDSIFTTVFGLAYGFSSYFVAFYWNIMWLDGLIFLPLVILGIKKLIDDGKINLYILSLFLSIISNYFISYMICIASCIFFIVYIMFKDISRKDFIKTILLFTVSSLIAGGLACFMLLPYISSLSSISATGDSFVFSKNFNFNIIDFISNNFSLTDSVVFSSQDNFLPNVSSGIASFILLFAFYFNSDIKFKHKLMATIFILILIISFIYVPLDFIWHGFHTPNDLPFRYSFIYVFIINIIAFYSATKIKSLRIRYGILIFVIFGIYLFYLSSINFLTKFGIEINFFFLLVSLLVFLLYKTRGNDIGKYVLLFIVCIDIFFNVKQNWEIDHDKNIFMDNYLSVNTVVDSIKKQDDSLYRIEKGFNQTLNDGAWYNYNGVSIFSSVAYEQMAKTQKKLGLPGNDVNSYYYKQNTPIYNSIMSIKYLIDINKDNFAYPYLNEVNYHSIYENDYYLPIMFAVDNKLKYFSNDDFNPFVNQMEFVEKSTGITDIFNKLEIGYDEEQKNYNFINDTLINLNTDETNSVALKINPIKDGNIYLYVNSYSLDHFLLNDEYYSITISEPYIIDAGYFNSNDEIELKITLTPEIYDVDILAYQMDVDKFENFYNDLNKNSIQITDFNNNYIEGIIEVDENKTVFSSLSYDEGFKVFVDDKKVETFSIDDAFLAFNLEKGTHNIKVIYEIPHLKIGIIISSISLLLLIFINFIKTKKIIN